MDKQELSALTAKINNYRTIKLENIPSMDLYMEQLLWILNQGLSNGSDNVAFTKTMINNYTKDDILPPPKNKKYSKHHIILLTLVHNLKGIFSINDIKLLLGPILKDISDDNDDLLALDTVYNVYLQMNDIFLKDFNKMFAKKISFIDNLINSLEDGKDKKTAQLFLSILALVAQANMNKVLAQSLLSEYTSNIK